MEQSHYVWSFSSIGGVKRVNIETGNDIAHLAELDQKLWTSLSCPVHGLEIDQRTLDLLDADKDGKIKVPEIIATVNWLTSVLKDPETLIRQEKVLHLNEINDATPEGALLLASAKSILYNLNKQDATSISIDDTADEHIIFAGTSFNGDGVITHLSATNENQKEVIASIVKCMGPVTDRSGEDGVSAEKISLFKEACVKYTNWMQLAEMNKERVLPFAENTADAFDAFQKVAAKVDDFFIRCNMVAFDERASNALNASIALIEQIALKNLAEHSDDLKDLPIASIKKEKTLLLSEGINPYWKSAMDDFKSKIGFTDNRLSETAWEAIKLLFEPYQNWLSKKEGASVESLGINKVRDVLYTSVLDELIELVAKDEALTKEVNNMLLVDKLVRLQRYLYTVIRNFVTFSDFYSNSTKAIFQAGTLYIDQRSLELCIKVTDVNKHASMAAASGMFLMYCDCVSKASNEKMTIAAALTNGDIDNLVVGRNALFYDRTGKDWDATVVKIVDNPISIRQAFFSPYRKVSNFIENQINKVAAERDAKVQSDMTKQVEEAPGKIATPQPKAPVQPFDVGKFVGIFAAIGLALGAIGTAVASIVAGFMGLVWWKMPFALMGLLLVISGPAMIMAYFKLRRRNLAPLLDANGWAINAKALVNIQFGNTLTHIASLPKGAKINLNDPFVKKQIPWIPYVILISVIMGAVLFFLWKYSIIHIRLW